METKEIIEQLLEMSLDMDYMDYVDYVLDTIKTLTSELEKIKGTSLYVLLEKVVEMNGNEELPLLNTMIKEATTIPF